LTKEAILKLGQAGFGEVAVLRTLVHAGEKTEQAANDETVVAKSAVPKTVVINM
jgi:hypothetical protein